MEDINMNSVKKYLNFLNYKYGGVSTENITNTGKRVIVVDEIEVQKLINNKYPNKKVMLFPDDVSPCHYCKKWFAWDGGDIMFKGIYGNGLYVCKKCNKIHKNDWK